MEASLKLVVHETLTGIVWKMLADPDREVLYIECREPERKSVAFSSFDVAQQTWQWQKVEFEEKWWIGLTAVTSGVLLLTVYTDTQNPDKKSVLAFDAETRQLRWWKNNFAVSMATGKSVSGVDMQFGAKEVVVDVLTGVPVNKFERFPAAQNFPVIRPFHYQEGTDHFNAVSTFLVKKQGLSPRFSIEYCEHRGLIFISVFSGEMDLVNNLFVYHANGELLMEERLGEGLKGIAADTFFVYAGCLIFVKNKHELVCYRIV